MNESAWYNGIPSKSLRKQRQILRTSTELHKYLSIVPIQHTLSERPSWKVLSFLGTFLGRSDVFRKLFKMSLENLCYICRNVSGLRIFEILVRENCMSLSNFVQLVMTTFGGDIR